MDIIGRGEQRDSKSIKLSTRIGSHIPNEIREEQHPARLRVAINENQKYHPNTKLRSATGVYNCIGLIFASRRTWIEPEHIEMILKEDGYKRLQGEEEVKIGDIIIYREEYSNAVTHIGEVIHIDVNIREASRIFTVLSQWGATGEYLHIIDDVPEPYGLPKEYWTDRRPSP